jgi:hypothetical protein
MDDHWKGEHLIRSNTMPKESNVVELHPSKPDRPRRNATKSEIAERRKKVRLFFDYGLSVHAIASRVGCTKDTVYLDVRAMGLSFRKRDGTRKSTRA